jgi:hypothetical protein
MYDREPIDTSPVYCDTMMTQNQFEIELQQKMKKNGSETVIPMQPSKIDKIEKIEKNVFDLKILPKIKNVAIDVILSVRDKIDRCGCIYIYIFIFICMYLHLNGYSRL